MRPRIAPLAALLASAALHAAGMALAGAPPAPLAGCRAPPHAVLPRGLGPPGTAALPRCIGDRAALRRGRALRPAPDCRIARGRASRPCPSRTARTDAPPNIVLVVFDDLGFTNFGVYSRLYDRPVRVETPHVDDLAAQGTVFTQFYANSPVCSPTRIALLTGLYPQQLGIRRVLEPHFRLPADASRFGIPADVETLPEVLKRAGYLSGHFGKWHIGDSRPEYLPLGLGFDRSVTATRGDRSVFDRRLLIDDTVEVPSEGHFDDAITDHAIEFIREAHDGPFFLNVWYNNPHDPFAPPERWAHRFPATEVGQLHAEIAHGDENVGRILRALDELGLSESTLVLVTSDNGATQVAVTPPPIALPGGKLIVFPEIDRADSNRPLRGFKGQPLEGGIRVPLIARYPGVVPSGAVSDELLAGFDLLPTLAELAGVDVSALELEGASALDVLRGDGAMEERVLVWEHHNGSEHYPSAGADWYGYAVRRDDWKLVAAHPFVLARPSLFDLAADVGEQTNRADRHPDIVEQLSAEYRAWRVRTGRIEARIARRAGSVRLDFGGARGRDRRISNASADFEGGALYLRDDPRFAFDDGDFSFQTALTPREIGREQRIAEHPSSWSLTILPSGVLELVLFDSVAPPTHSVALRSHSALRPHATYDVAFAVLGWRKRETARLYVDGVLEGESVRLHGVAAGSAPLVLGSDARRRTPLRGTLARPRFYTMSLTLEEVRRGMGGP